MKINPTVDAYISGVMDGTVVVGPWIKKAVKRHLSDLENGHLRGLHFDPDAANRVIEFCQVICIPPNQTEPMKLYPAQQVWLALTYGWMRKDGFRRFKRTFWLVAKKNGKSGLVSALLIYHLIADGEISARVACAATTMKQARTVFNEAVQMVKRSAELKALIKQSGKEPVHALSVSETGSRLNPLSRDTASEDGIVLSACCLDEIHRLKDTGLWTVLKLGGRTRKNFLMICISTAGASAGGTSVCWQEFEYGCKILDGIVEDDEVLPFFCMLDPKDNWKNPKVWVKSNPAIGHLFELETIEKEFAEAMGKPSALADFKRFALNIFSAESAEPAIAIEEWDKCCSVPPSRHPDPIKLRTEAIERLKGRECFGGVDLAPKLDTSSLVLLFPPRETTEKWEILEYFWCPADNIADRVARDRVPYDLWRDQGFLVTTPGNLTDPRYISDQIVELSNYFDMREIAYDAAWSSELIRMLSEAGFAMNKFVDFPQTNMKLNPSCQEFMRKVLRKEFVHSLNPIMRWQISNLKWNVQKGTGFIRPDRDVKRMKIDGPASLMMALARAIHPDNKAKSGFWVVTSA